MSKQHHQHVMEWVMLVRLYRDINNGLKPEAIRVNRRNLYNIYDKSISLFDSKLAVSNWHAGKIPHCLVGKVGGDG
jgi:hypothetical protein